MATLQRVAKPKVVKEKEVPTVVVQSKIAIKEPLLTKVESTFSNHVDKDEPPAYYIDFGKYIGPLYSPTKINQYATPLTSTIQPTISPDLFTSRTKLEKFYQSLSLKSNEPTNHLHQTGTQYGKSEVIKEISILTSYLSSLESTTNTNNKFFWPPLLVGIRGDECLIRFNLLSALIKLAKYDFDEVFSNELVSEMSRLFSSSDITKKDYPSFWEKLSITKDQLITIRRHYENALFEITKIREEFLKPGTPLNQELLNEVEIIGGDTNLTSQYDTTNKSKVFFEIGTNFGNNSETTLSNINVRDIISIPVLKWIEGTIRTNLATMSYYQTCQLIWTKPATADKIKEYHQRLYYIADKIHGAFEVMKRDLNSLIKIMDETDNNFDFKPFEVKNRETEKSILNTMIFHSIQYTWVCGNHSKTAKLNKLLSARVQRKIDNGEVIKNPEKNDFLENLEEPIPEQPKFIDSVKSIFSFNQEKKESQDEKKPINHLNTIIFGKLISHITKENKNVWGENSNHDFQSILDISNCVDKIDLPSYCSYIPYPYARIDQKIQTSSFNPAEKLKEVILLKSKADSVFTRKFKNDENEGKWWEHYSAKLDKMKTKENPNIERLLCLETYYKDILRINK
jgi:hypothetical protein